MKGSIMNKQKCINELLEHIEQMTSLIERWHEQHDEIFYVAEEHLESLKNELESLRDE